LISHVSLCREKLEALPQIVHWRRSRHTSIEANPPRSVDQTARPLPKSCFDCCGHRRTSLSDSSGRGPSKNNRLIATIGYQQLTMPQHIRITEITRREIIFLLFRIDYFPFHPMYAVSPRTWELMFGGTEYFLRKVTKTRGLVYYAYLHLLESSDSSFISFLERTVHPATSNPEKSRDTAS